nr:uncharacterized protein LOC108125494 [Drosophila bipectinata]
MQKLNKLFQSERPESSKLLNELMTSINSLKEKIIPPEINIDIFKDDFTHITVQDLYLGYAFERKIKSLECKEQEPEIRQVCVNFVQRLIMQLRERLPDNFNILKKVNIFAVDNILRPHKNILDFINIFEYFKITDIDELKSQLDKIHLIRWEKTEESMQFWAEVLAYRDAGNNNPFKALALFAIQLFSLPWSNAEVERVFSQMNIVKSKLRNKMALKSLNAILSISIFF